MQTQSPNTVAHFKRRPLFVATVGCSLLLLSVAMPVGAQDVSPPAGAATTSVQAPVLSLTLAQAIARALDSNPELSAARHEQEAATGQILQSGVRPNPELGYVLEDTQSRTRTQSLQINWPIELGGKRDARIAAAQRAYDVAGADLDARAAEVRAAVVTAYFDVLNAQERVDLAKATEQLADKATDVVSRRVLAGKVSPVEETKSRVAGAGVKIESSQAASELRAAKIRLASLVGAAPGSIDAAAGRADDLPALPSVASLRDRLSASPSIRRAQLEIQRRTALVSVESSKRVPDVTLSLGVKRPNELQRNQIVLGVSVPLPVFDRNQGNLLEALRREEKARDELEATKVRGTAEVMQARERLAAARDQVDTLTNTILPGAKSAYDAATVGFENGKFAFLDVLDAQRTYFASKTQYLRTLADAHRAAAEIDRIVGESATAPVHSSNRDQK